VGEARRERGDSACARRGFRARNNETWYKHDHHDARSNHDEDRNRDTSSVHYDVY
jgi:hypothetical protein